jgi:hypothetical protein
MMHSKCQCARLLCLLLISPLLSPISVCHAALELTLGLGAHVQSSLHPTVPNVDDDFFEQSIFTPIGDEARVSTTSAFARASGSVDYGRVKLLATSSLTLATEGMTRSANSAGIATWEDTLNFAAPDPELDGTRGTAHLQLSVVGQLIAHKEVTISPFVNPATCSYTVELDFISAAGTQFQFYHGQYRANGDLELFGNPFSGDAFGVKTGEIDFIFGQPVRFLAKFTVGTAIGAGPFIPDSLDATANFANSFTWLGFTDIRDANGTLVDGVRVLGESGIDWGQPAVSEPSSACVLILLMVPWATRRGLKRRKLANNAR